MEKINPFVTIAGAPVFIPLAFVAPFPSVVSLPVKDGLSHNEYYYHVAGNLFWITLAFFSFYGVYYALRYNRQKMAPIWAFIIGYQFVLLKAMYFTSVRFSYPLKPLLLIMAAYGLSQMKNKKWYPIYLAGAVVMIVGWNFVRFKGRG
jgi:fucose 4-O-acetylase-like acetyltransferase